MSKSSFAFPILLLVSLFFSSVETAGLENFCPVNEDLGLVVTEKQDTQMTTLDAYSYYKNDVGQSAILLVSKGDSGPFKMKTLTNQGAPTNERDCKGSDALTFQSLYNEFLFMTDSSKKVYVCKFNKNANSVALELTFKDLGNVVQFFVLSIFNDANNIYATAILQGQTKVVKYVWEPTPTGNKIDPTVESSKFLIIQAIDRKLSTNQLGGTQVYLYDSSTNYFIHYQQSTSLWKNDNGFVGSGKIVGTFPLLYQRAIFTVTDADLRASRILTFSGTPTEHTQLAIIGSDDPIISYFSDTLFNFGRVSKGKFTWITMDAMRSFYKSIILNPTGDESIFNVAFSKNKSTILSTGGKLSVFRHEGDNQYLTLFSQKLTENALVLDGTTKEYRISLSCICRAIRTLACFSQSLNCLILNKAETQCLNQTGDVYSW